MDIQNLLNTYLGASPGDEYRYYEPLSDAIGDLVHKSASKRETSDIEDFEEDCVLAIWTKIAAIKAGVTDVVIENLEAFVRRSVHNRYCDAIRRKRPAWYNLKLELLDIFSGKANIEGFALWQHPEMGARMCGFAEWENMPRNGTLRLRELNENIDTFRRKHLRNRDPRELATYELAAAMLDYCGAPVEVDVLTSSIADLTQVQRSEPLSIDAQPDNDDESGSPVDRLVSPDTDVERQVVGSGWFGHVVDWFWKEFMLLSVKQRKAVLYGLSGDQVMALAGAVGFKEIADAVELSPESLADLVDKLPLPDAVTAEELGVQARAVPSVRFKAWGRIRRRAAKSSLALDDEEAFV